MLLWVRSKEAALLNAAVSNCRRKSLRSACCGGCRRRTLRC